MPAGRPRTVAPPPEDLIKLGQEMLEWVEINNPPHLSCWWSKEKFISEKDWDTICRKQEFIPYYDASLRIIALNYIIKNSDIEPNVKNRFLRFYFKDLKREEDETKAYEIKLKADSDATSQAAYIAHHASMMAYLQGMRETQSLPAPEEQKSEDRPGLAASS